MTRHRETPHGDSTGRQPRGEEGGVSHDEIAEVAFHTIRTAHEQGITDPLRLAHAVAVALKLAESEADR